MDFMVAATQASGDCFCARDGAQSRGIASRSLRTKPILARVLALPVIAGFCKARQEPERMFRPARLPFLHAVHSRYVAATLGNAVGRRALRANRRAKPG